MINSSALTVCLTNERDNSKQSFMWQNNQFIKKCINRLRRKYTRKRAESRLSLVPKAETLKKTTTILNKVEPYSHDVRETREQIIPTNAVYAVMEGEVIVPNLLPKECSPVNELEKKLDDLDMAIIEEIGRSKYLSSLQIYQLVSMRGFLVQRNYLRKKILRLTKYRIIRESVIKLSGAEKGVHYHELDGKGFIIAQNRGVLFHKGNMYMSYAKRVAQNIVESPTTVKRILAGNQVVCQMLMNKIKMQRFGIMETFGIRDSEGVLKEGAILRTTANITLDENEVLAYEVVRDNEESYMKLADKVERYYTLLRNYECLIDNERPIQLVICGESREHNLKIVDFLKKKSLWSEAHTILFTEDLLIIRDCRKSIYEIKENELIWYQLPQNNGGSATDRVSA